VDGPATLQRGRVAVPGASSPLRRIRYPLDEKRGAPPAISRRAKSYPFNPSHASLSAWKELGNKGAPVETRKPHRKKEDYKLRTHLIHGNYDSTKWTTTIMWSAGFAYYGVSAEFAGARGQGVCAVRLCPRSTEPPLAI